MSGNTPMENMDSSINEPKLCVNMCGFFGNPMTANMCSKCFKMVETETAQKDSSICEPQAETVAEAIAEVEAEVCVETHAEAHACCSAHVHEPSSCSSSCGVEVEEPARKEQVKKNRCFDCNKKVGLLGYECRCGYIYCATHRYAEDHCCTYDFKLHGRESLTEQMPVVIAPKITKI